MKMPFKRVPDSPDYLVFEDGDIFSEKSDKILKAQLHRSGYLHVNLGGRTRKVHEVVLTTYAGPRPEGAVARHLDGDSLNNHKNNLAWGTPKENVADQIKHGTMKNMFPKGENHPNSTLSDLDVEEIRELEGILLQREIAKLYGVNPATISKIMTGSRR